MAMRKRPEITELGFDRKVESLAEWAASAVSPFKDRSSKDQDARKARAENDFAFFAQTYLPHYFEDPPAPFHGELVEMVDRRPTAEDPIICGAAGAPRGFAKSTVVAFGYSLWCLVFNRRNFIVIGSETASLAEDHVASIGAELTENRRIAYDFNLRLTRLREGDLIISGGGRVLARGAGQQVRGVKHRAKRPDLIILDDLESDDSAENPKRVKKLLKWILGTVMGAFGKMGTLFIVGTVLAKKSALNTILHSTEEPWKYWARVLYRALDDEGHSLWPAMYSDDYLAKLKQKMGAIQFEREKQNNPRDAGAMFQEEWLKTFEPVDLDGKALAVAGFCDPSARAGEANDYKAVITVGLDQAAGIYYVLDAFVRRCSINAVAKAIVHRHRDRGYLLFGIEDNGFQILFLEEVERVGNEEKVILPITGVTHSGLSKEMRLSGLSPLVERGKIRFLAPEYRDADYNRLIEQLIFFPSPTVHDDGPDGLEGAVSLLKQPSGEWPSGVAPRGRKAA